MQSDRTAKRANRSDAPDTTKHDCETRARFAASQSVARCSMTHLSVEFFHPDNKHPSAGHVHALADVGTRFAPFCGEESRLARAQRKIRDPACEMVHHALRARLPDCQRLPA